MLNINLPLPVKFFCGFIYAKEDSYQESKQIFINKFGSIDFESQAIEFTFTEYYKPEMGMPLWRKFISFKDLQDPDNFVGIKLDCIEIEKRFAKDNKRVVNIDPGYINEAKLVLTTTKDFSHRIYLSKGIFAEITLSFQNGEFRDYPTTFPDYRTKIYKDIFIKIRDLYRRQIGKNG